MDKQKQPDKTISDVTRMKPRLLVFDDSVSQLSAYCAKLSEKYAVEGVLVSSYQGNDDALKRGLATGDWSKASQYSIREPERFDAVKHVVTNQEELRALLQQRPPADYVLSDYQMREWYIDGADVMRIAHEELPNAPRAIHTGSHLAKNEKISELELDQKDKLDRMKLVNAMRRYDFKIFPKPDEEKDFNPAVIEAYFAAPHGPTPD